ncbi:splicing factor [Xylographa trunciseda]|nr:splicing factor [Xylographa trunciseda]
MAAEQRKLLEQLMGASSSSRHAQLAITDPKVCRSFIVGTCPHDLFTNTKQDLGPCPKVHSEPLKSEYDASADKSKYGFEYDYMRDMQKYIDACNHRIDGAQQRLEKTPDEIRQTNVLVRTLPPTTTTLPSHFPFPHTARSSPSPHSHQLTLPSPQLKQISDLSRTINTGLLEISVLGESGSVATAYTEFYKVRTAKAAKEEKERELRSLSDTSGPSGHQKLQVCDVCGAYLSRLDNDRRLADHFYGKMHLGYAQMRKTWEGLQKELKGRAPPNRDEGPGAGRGEEGYGEGGWGGRGRGGYRGGGGFRGGFRGRGGYNQRW